MRRLFLCFDTGIPFFAVLSAMPVCRLYVRKPLPPISPFPYYIRARDNVIYRNGRVNDSPHPQPHSDKSAAQILRGALPFFYFSIQAQP